MTSKLLFDESPLLVLPTLAQKIGLNESIVLQQIHYWLNPESNSNYYQGRYWVYNTYKQWQKQFSFWSAKTIQRVIKNLEDQNILISFIKHDPQTTKYYSIDYEALSVIGETAKLQASTDDMPSEQINHPNLSRPISPSGQPDQGGMDNLTTPSMASGQIVQTDNRSATNPHALENAASSTSAIENSPNLINQSGQIDHPNLSKPTSPSGQSDQRGLDNLTRPLMASGQLVQADKIESINSESLNDKKTEPFPANPLPKATDSSGQIDHPNLSRPTPPSGQPDQRGLDNLTRLYTENTTEITLPPPPLTPPPDQQVQQKAESEQNAQPGAPAAERKLQNSMGITTSDTPYEPSASSQEEEEEENLQNLIKIWNDEVQSKLLHSPKEILLTKARAQQLRKLLAEVFGNDLDRWRPYCQQIGQCKFLLGKNPSGFRVSLNWALQPKNAIKVIEGVIYDKPENGNHKTGSAYFVDSNASRSEFDKTLLSHCKQNQFPDEWLTTCRHLERLLERPTFNSWFFDVKPITLSKQQVVLECKTRFRRSYVDDNFRSELLISLKKSFPEIREMDIKFTVATEQLNKAS